MPYIHFTEDQKLRANSVDLVEFLRRQGEKLISSGQDKRLTSDHSITVHGNEWYDHAAERGGHAISFVQNFYGLTYPEAVTRLLNGEQGEVYVPAEKKEKKPPKEFALPPSNQAMRRVYAYLLQQRHISREVLSAFAQKGLIYESRELSIDQTKVYHNAVFVGFDERGVARHAHKRGLYTQGKSYRGNIEGSDPRCSFHWVGTSDRLYVFEAPSICLPFSPCTRTAGSSTAMWLSVVRRNMLCCGCWRKIQICGKPSFAWITMPPESRPPAGSRIFCGSMAILKLPRCNPNTKTGTRI